MKHSYITHSDNPIVRLFILGEQGKFYLTNPNKELKPI